MDKTIFKNNKGITVIALIFIIIILVLAGVFIFKVTNSNNKEERTQELQQLADRDINITNFTLNMKKDNGAGEVIESKIVRKDNVYVITTNNGNSLTWTNENTKEQILINKESNTAVISGNEILLNTFDMEDIEKYTLKNVDYKYAYERMERVNNRMCYVIEADTKYYTENNGYDNYVDENEINQMSVKAYVDEETGLIVKEVANYNNTQMINKYDFEINCVTDKDIAKPDLTGYTIEKIE